MCDTPRLDDGPDRFERKHGFVEVETPRSAEDGGGPRRLADHCDHGQAGPNALDTVGWRCMSGSVHGVGKVMNRSGR